MKRIVVACQGGALHAAFTVGVLRRILQVSEANPGYQLIGFSGTSAGALCAVACWYGLHQGGPAQAVDTLSRVWEDFAAQTPVEQIFNQWLVSTLRLQGKGVVPEVKFSPYAPFFPLVIEQMRYLGYRREFVDYTTLLEKHIDFARARQFVAEPRLLVGAVNVLSGDCKAFDSKKGEISAEAIRASGSIPGLGARAVEIEGNLYWDGLYSQNPPIRNFLADPESAAEKPDEIWLIQLNPKSRPTEPKAVEDIQDRDNELAANLALEQEKKFIEKVNEWVAAGYLPRDDYKTITVQTITLSPALSQELDFASKLDRSQAFINRLMADGQMQAQAFLDNWLVENSQHLQQRAVLP